MATFACLAGTDPYAILGVPRAAAPGHIRKAYLQQSLRAHPDKISKDVKAMSWDCVQKAYEILSRADLRRCYDIGGLAEVVRQERIASCHAHRVAQEQARRECTEQTKQSQRERLERERLERERLEMKRLERERQERERQEHTVLPDGPADLEGASAGRREAKRAPPRMMILEESLRQTPRRHKPTKLHQPKRQRISECSDLTEIFLVAVDRKRRRTHKNISI